ncbi:MAG: DUF4105 domain-containing protein, partial [Candidatus Wallbacteria bacterium]|nr:DUF4105 domain-containing protein [Candidatus Wallbacteria bacterium]
LFQASVCSANLSADQRELKIVSQQGSVFELDNVRWGFEGNLVTKKPVFKNTKVDISKVRDVYFWLETFPPEALAGHGMLAFVMDSPCVESADGKADIGLVYSFEAWLEQGQKYSPLEGMKKNCYRLIYQVSTIKDRVQLSIVIPNHKMYQYRVNLTAEQKQELLGLMLTESAVDRSGEYYHTYYNSCVFNAIRLINEVLPDSQKLKMYVAKDCPNLSVTFPPIVPDYLSKQGLICEKQLFTLGSQVINIPYGSGHVYDISLQDLNYGTLYNKLSQGGDIDLAEYLDYLRLAKSIFMEMKNQTEIIDQAQYDKQLSEISRIIASSEENFLDRFTETPDTLAWNLRWYVKKPVNPEFVNTIDCELIVAICEALKNSHCPYRQFLTDAKKTLIDRQADR